MTNTDVQSLNKLLAPVAVAAGVALLCPAASGAEMAALWTLAVVVTLAHIHYGICVVSCPSDWRLLSRQGLMG